MGVKEIRASRKIRPLVSLCMILSLVLASLIVSPLPAKATIINAGSILVPIAGGNYTAYGLDTAGNAWAWGYNGYGELGDGTNTNSKVPVSVSGMNGVTALAAAKESGYALKTDGTVWAWGSNDNGRLGINSSDFTFTSNIPVQVSGLSEVYTIASRLWSAYALKTDGTVWAWGLNSNGQLGDNTTEPRNAPVKIVDPVDPTGFMSNVTAISCSDYSGYAVKTDGTVWAWGLNTEGQLGSGTTASSYVPVQVMGLTNVTAVAGGFYTGYALKNDGTVWAWGLSDTGQLGNETAPLYLGAYSETPLQVSNLSNIVSIASQGYVGYALDANGNVWYWGEAIFGKINIPAKVPDPSDPSGYLSGVTAIAGGFYSGYAVKSDGGIWSWGYNEHGQLGNDSIVSSNVPVQVIGFGGSGLETTITSFTLDKSGLPSSGGTVVATVSGTNLDVAGTTLQVSLDGGTTKIGTVSNITGTSAQITFDVAANATASDRTDTVTLCLNGSATAYTATINVSKLATMPPVQFKTAQHYNVVGPLSVGAGDFDGDGIIDLVTANGNAKNISFLKGNGDGTFVEKGEQLNIYGLHYITPGKFNEDIIDDFAVVTSSGVAIVLGATSGTFAAPTSVSGTGSSPSAAVAADFNKDGKEDLAVTNQSSNDISIVLGNGDGTFQTASNINLNAAAFQLTAGDFNKDGNTDLALIVQIGGTWGNYYVRILAGAGNGIFTAEDEFAAGPRPSGIASGYFYGSDDSLDLVVSTWESANDPDWTKEDYAIGYSNDGAGTFTKIATYPTRKGPLSIKCGDFNNDGLDDFATANYYDKTVSVYPGSGNGFSSIANFAVGDHPVSLITADLNADSKDDLVTANNWDSTVSVLLNGTDTSNEPELAITTTTPLPSAVQGATYSATVSASGGTAPYTWKATNLPAGLSINAATGVISGTPTEAGTLTVNVTVADYAGHSANKALTLTVNQAAAKLSITSASLPAGTAGTAYSTTLTASGGTAPYIWSATGLPAGLSINAATGVISGTPAAAGTYTVNVTVNDNVSDSTGKTLTLTVNSVLVPSSGGGGGGSVSDSFGVTWTNLPEGTPGKAFSHKFSASGGSWPYKFKVTRGSLPRGLSMTEDGTFSGTPILPGTYIFTITVTDNNGRTSSQEFTYIVKLGPNQKQITLALNSRQASIGGQPYTIDAEPFVDIRSNRTLVGIRFVSEALGAIVEWLPDSHQVKIKDGGKELVLTIGVRNVLVNGQNVAIDCESVILPPGRTFVPLRFVSETLGAMVDYDEVSMRITIIR